MRWNGLTLPAVQGQHGAVAGCSKAASQPTSAASPAHQGSPWAYLLQPGAAAVLQVGPVPVQQAALVRPNRQRCTALGPLRSLCCRLHIQLRPSCHCCLAAWCCRCLCRLLSRQHGTRSSHSGGGGSGRRRRQRRQRRLLLWRWRSQHRGKEVVHFLLLAAWGRRLAWGAKQQVSSQVEAIAQQRGRRDWVRKQRQSALHLGIWRNHSSCCSRRRWSRRGRHGGLHWHAQHCGVADCRRCCLGGGCLGGRLFRGRHSCRDGPGEQLPVRVGVALLLRHVIQQVCHVIHQLIAQPGQRQADERARTRCGSGQALRNLHASVPRFSCKRRCSGPSHRGALAPLTFRLTSPQTCPALLARATLWRCQAGAAALPAGAA